MQISLHGDESLGDIARLPYPVVKRLHPVQWMTSAKDMLELPENLKYWLLDPGVGTGEVFNWSELAHQGRNLSDCWVAGGLRYNNVRECIALLQPKVLDVSSGVEKSRPGIKDLELVRQFVSSVNSG